MVADEYEKLLQENGMLSEKIRHMSGRLEEYHNLEETLRNSMMTAERIAVESKEQSRRDAEIAIDEARIRGERILEDSRERLRMLSREIQELRTQKDLFVQRFQSVLEAQTQLLDSRREELDRVDEMDARASGLITGSGVSAEPAMADPEPAETQEPLVGVANEPENGHGEGDAATGELDAAGSADASANPPDESPSARAVRESVAAVSGGSVENGFFRGPAKEPGFFERNGEEEAQR
jgi:cell division initiation protein